MKCLKIENGKGLLSVDGVSFIALDSITKDQILILVDKSLTLGENLEFDEFDEALIQNQAHKVIYRDLYQKLIELQSKREQFNEEISDQYRDAYEKYKLPVDEDGGDSV